MASLNMTCLHVTTYTLPVYVRRFKFYMRPQVIKIDSALFTGGKTTQSGYLWELT